MMMTQREMRDHLRKFAIIIDEHIKSDIRW